MDIFLPVWNTFLVHPLLSLLVAAFDLFHDFGIAVVLVTFAIRLSLYPLYVTQIRSMRAQQELAPALADIKAKYGKDRQKVSEEQMKLYKERGFNPAMGCLPLLLQMPILFAMYGAFLFFVPTSGNPPPDGVELANALWSFVPNPIGPGEHLDLTAHWLPWITGGLGSHDPLFILPVLAGATQLFASIMAQPTNQAKTTDPQQKMMQSMAYYFPLITVFIAQGLPAGLGLYWIATTVFQIVQQYFVTGWGQLPRFIPALANIPSPADKTLRARQQAAISEAESDMRAKGARPSEGPGAQTRKERRAAKLRRRR